MEGSGDPDELDDVQMSLAAESALRLAASSGFIVETHDVLVSLIREDAGRGWETVQLRTTFLTPDGPRDGRSGAGGSWQGIMVSTQVANGVRIAARIAGTYEMEPMPAAILAIGMLSDPAAGAARAILGDSDLEHRQMIDLVQGEVLGTDLEGLYELLAEDSDRQALATTADAAPPGRGPFASGEAETLPERARAAAPPAAGPGPKAPVPSPLDPPVLAGRLAKRLEGARRSDHGQANVNLGSSREASASRSSIT